MAKKKSADTFESLWKDLGESDFKSGLFDDNDIGDYNLERMTTFIANVNYCRQIPKLIDGLKPVERRILYSMYSNKLYHNARFDKSASVVGDVTKDHPHGDTSIYQTIVRMTQSTKLMVPLIAGKGSFGSNIDDTAAHMRYTDIKLSQYAEDCFFSDFDEDCVDMEPNATRTRMVPRTLPAKYPNIIINGGISIATGNSFLIPPFNIEDVMRLTKALIENPLYDDVYMYPDIPSGCDVVENERKLRQICDTGTGTMEMRARIDIEDSPKGWVLTIRSLPWLVTLTNVYAKIIELAKAGKITLLDTKDFSELGVNKRTNEKFPIINMQLLIPKAMDPKAVRNILFKNTELGKSLIVQCKVVEEGFTLGRPNLRTLILTWLDERREYKRRLYNKKITKIASEISLREILIELSSTKNINKTMNIIQNNNRSGIEKALVEEYGMSSYQAARIADMRLAAFSKDSQERYLVELDKFKIDLAELFEIVSSENNIDKIILKEIDDLKKYAKPRQSEIISIDGETHISDTDHVLVITKNGLIKKLPADKDGRSTYGIFADGDYPIDRITVNNLDNVIIYDSLGKYSIIPVHTIENTDHKHYGNRIYDITKLDGAVIHIDNYINETLDDTVLSMGHEVYNIAITAKGVIKKTLASKYQTTTSVRNSKAIKLRDGDELKWVQNLLDDTHIIAYTKNGRCIKVNIADITTSEKDSIGVQCIDLIDDDECKGFSVESDSDEYIVVITEKGMIKKCDISLLKSGKRRKDDSYLIQLDDNDNVFQCISTAGNSVLIACLKSQFKEIPLDEIPLLTRKAKGKKLIPIANGDSLITCMIGDKL